MQDYPTPAQELEMLEISLENAKAKVALAESMQRLLKNKDFKRVFVDFFLGTEVARAVKLMAEPSLQNPAQQEMINKMLIAVGQVDQFIRNTITIGDMAASGIADDEAERERILAEEAEEA